jgi:MFS family permease
MIRQKERQKMSNGDRILITHDDAYSPKVDEVLAREGSFGMDPASLRDKRGEEERSLLVRIVYSSTFYTALAGMIGAALGWSVIEPFFNDSVGSAGKQGFFEGIGALLLWPIIAGLGGLFIGAVEGVVSRNWSRAFMSGLIGMSVGFGGALVLNFVAGILYNVTLMMVMNLGDPKFKVIGNMKYFIPDDCNRLGYMIWTIGRAVAWAPMGIVFGLGSAIHMRSKKLAFNGIVGGLIGAFLGGLLFNPLMSMFPGKEAWLSRGFGFTAIGLGAGVLIGLVENLSKTAWLHVEAGALAGKQFVLYKNPTVLGSSPKCEIFLFKDESIEPKHAAIHSYGTRYEIEDLDSSAGTFVNGQKITRQPLKSGDRVYIGETVLDFSEKENN